MRRLNLIAAQAQQAEKMEKLAGIIAGDFGKSTSLNEDRVFGSRYTWQDGDIRIIKESGIYEESASEALSFSSLRVYSAGEEVLYVGGGDLYVYSPGAWEKELQACHDSLTAPPPPPRKKPNTDKWRLK